MISTLFFYLFCITCVKSFLRQNLIKHKNGKPTTTKCQEFKKIENFFFLTIHVRYVITFCITQNNLVELIELV